MLWNDIGNQACSMARTLAVIGDRWTLLILRECFLRVRRFDDFQTRLGIGRPILADRLQKLVTNGVLTKEAYQQKPMRYEYRLTSKGLDLYPVMVSIVHWGDMYLAKEEGRPLCHEHLTCGNIFDPVLTCSECGEAVHPRAVKVLPGPGASSANGLPVDSSGKTIPVMTGTAR